jgi:hypothetical protein
MLIEKGAINDYDKAKKILMQFGSVKAAYDHLRSVK